MGVKTPFTPDDFVRMLLPYSLGAFRRAKPIERGTVQTNYVLWTTRGRFVFRYYENRSRGSVLFEKDLLTHLAGRRFPCPAPVQNTEGKYVGTYREKPYLIFQHIEGRHIEHPGRHHKRQLITKAAQLHMLTRSFRSRHASHRWHYDAGLCRALARREAARIGTGDALGKLGWLVHMLRTLDLPLSLPKGICHCDFHVSNILFREDELTALLDFDDANITFLTFDLVGLIDHWAWPHRADMLDFSQARWIVQEYAAHRALSPMERKHLYEVYKLSILLDAVWYFDRGTAADCRERGKIDALTGLGRQAFFDELFCDGGTQG
jgi:Ser/Thr protein kinase RdoA (MazF antagonist)